MNACTLEASLSVKGLQVDIYIYIYIYMYMPAPCEAIVLEI
jgi:hypothetical protein